MLSSASIIIEIARHRFLLIFKVATTWLSLDSCCNFFGNVLISEGLKSLSVLTCLHSSGQIGLNRALTLPLILFTLALTCLFKVPCDRSSEGTLSIVVLLDHLLRRVDCLYSLIFNFYCSPQCQADLLINFVIMSK